MPVRESGGKRYWEPAYDFGEKKDHPIDPAPTGDDAERWVEAPASSHCWGFRFIDARGASGESRFQRKFGSLRESGRGYGKGESLVFVRFRTKDGSGIEAEYQYRFADHEAGKTVFDNLCSSPHPYADVVLPKLIKAGVPYSRVS
jgi:hypothetical protein